MIVKTETLRNALEIVKPGLAKKERIEQTTSFAFKDGRVVTYNDEISISHPVEGLDVVGAIPAEHLYKFLTKVKKEEIEIEIVETQLITKAGKSKAGFLLESEIKLPLKDEVIDSEKWKPLPEKMLKALSLAYRTCSNDVSRPKLTCVHISKSGFVEATDGYRLLRYYLNEECDEDYLIPSTSCQEVIDLNMKEYYVEGGWVHFRNEEDTILSSRILVEEYMNITPFLQVDGIKIMLPKMILEALDRVSIFAKRKRITDESVEIEIRNKRLKLKADSDTSWVEEEINFAYEGIEFSIIVAPSLLRDALSESLECIITENRMKFHGDGWEYVVALKERNKS